MIQNYFRVFWVGLRITPLDCEYENENKLLNDYNWLTLARNNSFVFKVNESYDRSYFVLNLHIYLSFIPAKKWKYSFLNSNYFWGIDIRPFLWVGRYRGNEQFFKYSLWFIGRRYSMTTSTVIRIIYKIKIIKSVN